MSASYPLYVHLQINVASYHYRYVSYVNIRYYTYNNI